MRSTIFIIVFGLFPFLINAQEEVYSIVEEMPVFVGCENVHNIKKRDECSTEKIKQFIQDSTRYPKRALGKGLTGMVFVKYIIDESGKVTNPIVVRGIPDAEMLDEEALRVVRLFPDYLPGKQRGSPVKVQFIVPVKFE